MEIVKSMNIIYSHIFREWNSCVDKLTNYGTTVQVFYWWDLLPNFVRENFFRNRLGHPNYRFK